MSGIKKGASRTASPDFLELVGALTRASLQ
jgi:hypothetical protein